MPTPTKSRPLRKRPSRRLTAPAIPKRSGDGAAASREAPGDSTPPDLGPIQAMWQLGGPDYLPLRLLLVGKLIDLNIGRLLAAYSVLSVAEWRVVAQLAVLHTGSVREMARQACVDPAEVSRSVASLETRGFVERQLNQRDRRSPRFSLTSAGAANFEMFRPHWRRLQKALVASLSAAETRATEHAITVFARACLDFLACHDLSQPATE